MTVYSILDKYAEEQGWGLNSKFGLAMSFIADNCDIAKWEAFLKEQAKAENEPDDGDDDELEGGPIGMLGETGFETGSLDSIIEEQPEPEPEPESERLPCLNPGPIEDESSGCSDSED